MKRIFYAFAVGCSFLLYYFLNINPNNLSKARIIKFWIDEYIPFIPIFSIPYIIYIPFLLVSIFYFIFLTNKFFNFSISFIFCQVVATAFYVFYQTTVPRPEVIATDIFSNLVRFIYLKDQPYNCFPSLHVSLSLISGFYWTQHFPKVKTFMIVFVSLISISTIFIKQHYLPDVISGIILALISFHLGQFFHKFIKS